jgi:tetratricopeptide (TPR) repeat protein
MNRKQRRAEKPGRIGEMFAEGLRCHQAGRLDEAERLYRKILAADPRHADSLHLLGVIASQMRRHDLAAELIGRAIAVQPSTASYHFNLGNVLRQQGRPADACACYRRALDLEPGLAEAANNLGLALKDMDRLPEAADSYRRALALQPGHADAHNNLGNVLKELGRMGEAVACYRQAIVADPRHAMAHNNLGNALKERGDLDEAAACYRRALALQPGLAMAHNNLGAVLKETGRPDEAAACYRRALELDPDFAEAHSNLALLRLEQGGAEDAAVCFRKLLALRPNDAAAHNGLGRALKRQGRIEEAVASYRRAIDLRPDFPDAQVNLGAALRELGRFVEAEAAQRQVLRSAPDARAWFELSHCRKFAEADRPLVCEIGAALENPGLSDQDRSLLHFASGKICDDLADYSAAIGHFDKANRLGAGDAQFDAQEFSAAVDWLIDAFPKPSPQDQAASDSQLPLLIVGMPRSGTTLVEQILASHPQVAAGGELDFWLQNSGWVGKQCIAALDPVAARKVADDYLALLAGIGPTARRVTDKMPHNFLFLGLVHHLFPAARILHCRRDPRDTALSIYFTRFAQGHDFAFRRADIVAYYRQYRRLMAHWRAVLPPGRMLELDYESLIGGEDAIRALVAFCGLEWDEACRDFHHTARPVATAAAWQVRQPLYRSSVGRWRHYEPWLGELRELETDR